ncbi:MAG: ATP-binding protein, partial [Myxococcota bacterium]
MEADETVDRLRAENAALRRRVAALEAERELGTEPAAREPLWRVLEHIPAGVIVARPDGGLLYGNPEVERIFAQPFSRATQDHEWALYPLDGEARLAPERLPMNRTLRTGEVVVGEELRVRRPDGSWRTISANTAPVRDSDGRIALGVAAFVDVTDRRAAEADRASRGARDAFSLALADRVRVLADPRAVEAEAARILGEHLDADRVVYGELDPGGALFTIGSHYNRGVEPIVGVRRLDDFGPQVIAAIRAGRTVVARDVADDPELTEVERASYREIGVAAHVSVPLRKDQRMVAFFAVHQRRPRDWLPDEVRLVEETAERTWDAVVRARAEAALHEAEARFRALFDSIDEGFCLCEMVLGPDGAPIDYRFLEVNGLFERMTGLNQPTGRTARELVPGLEQHWVDTYARVAFGREPLRFENGSSAMGRWFDVFAAPVEPRGRFALVFNDVTERRRMEASLREQDVRKDEFLAMLAHELRNPLAPIRTAVELLNQVAPNDAALHGIRDLIDRQVRHLVRLVDDLLDVARVSRGKIQLRKEPCELGAVVAQAIEITRTKFDVREHRFTVSLPPEPVWVDGDFTRLTQVVGNLLSNAAKYTDDRGAVHLSVERLPGPSDEVRIQVTDTGRGIDPSALGSVFELFYQADRTLDRAAGGLGIGLSLVRSLVELHGGRVSAHSDGRGTGSAFVVPLPALPRDVVIPVATPAPPPPPRRRRVLVVDDNRDVAESMARLLELAGHAVSIAYDGRAAVDLAVRDRPDVVLLDIGLPQLDGYEACRAIREAGLDTVRIVA